MKNTIVFALIALSAAGFARADTKLVIKGSDTLGAKLVPTLAEEYKAKTLASLLKSPLRAPPRASPPSLMARPRSA